MLHLLPALLTAIIAATPVLALLHGPAEDVSAHLPDPGYDEALHHAAPDVDPREVPAGIRVRPPYQLTVAATNLHRPRLMTLDPAGNLYISLPHDGEIKALRDSDGDGFFETAQTFVREHPSVHGLAWHDHALWFAETGAIFRAEDTTNDLVADETQPITHPGRLPAGGRHWRRTLLIHNNRLYTSIGDSADASDESGSPRQKIWSFDLLGRDARRHAGGLFNTEELAIRPGTDELWGFDQSTPDFAHTLEKHADHAHPISDFNPPSELNHYTNQDFFGHPFLVGTRVPHPKHANHPSLVEIAAQTVPPAWLGGAHWTPTGLAFYDADQFPNLRGDLFVAYYGSWKRTDRAGYCVSVIHFEDGHPWGEQKYVDFLTPDGQVLGRPVDVIVEPATGDLLITDDLLGRVYRLQYKEK